MELGKYNNNFPHSALKYKTTYQVEREYVKKKIQLNPCDKWGAVQTYQKRHPTKTDEKKQFTLQKTSIDLFIDVITEY